MNKNKTIVVLLSVACAALVTLNILKDDTVALVESENQNNVTKQNEKKVADIAHKEIFGKYEREFSWAINPTIPENLFTPEATSVVQLKVLSMGEAEILPQTEEFITQDPYTPIEVEILDTISGNPLSGNKTIYIDGGDIKISKLMKFIDKEKSNKMGFDKLSEKDRDNMYISYTSDNDYKMKIGKEYTVFLVKQTEDIYTIMGSGYGIFDIEKDAMGKKTFKNVLTGKESALQF
ncbi:hypothetical protein [Mesobacillus subterraneus]|uniref:Lipoprotein n=1 Tax=Mesobacillus subterraneus TaxID=285983 RepID=A0A427TE28_9BACI|nr:hypothetical protein [Mesobacillus subterraneus]RSD21091.1 hypothetical protein EJA10_22600 [Mesobacillus subterraneus]